MASSYDFARSLAEFTERQLASSNVQVGFDRTVRTLSKGDLEAAPCPDRLDLRDVPCLTIDCADTKDMDDAVGVVRTAGGYLLCVHIADVGAYVRPGSALDATAMRRGTSYYLPDRTIPMLPPVLSEDLCSLNPGVDRNALSVLVDLDVRGRVLNYEISKTLIRSCAKGAYEEVDELLVTGDYGAFGSKYAQVADQLPAMRDLARMLRRRRADAGACVEDEAQCRVTVADGEVHVLPRKRGDAEAIVEEFMVLANSLVADYLVRHGLPGIYRTQHREGTLAEYNDACSSHAQLALESYAHFTSPIRRLADLKVHQVLTTHLQGCGTSVLHYIFDDAVAQASDVAQRRQRTANSVSRACEKRCLRHWFEVRAGRIFSGTAWCRDRSGHQLVLVDETGSCVLLPSGMRVRDGERLHFGVCVDDWHKNPYAVNVCRIARAA